MKKWKRWLTTCLAAVMVAGSMPVMTFASANAEITSDKITRGKTGKSVTVSFQVTNNSGQDVDNLAIAFDVSGAEIWDEDADDMIYGYAFPFELTGSLNDTDNPKSAGSLKAGKSKSVSLSATVRRDLNDGYYKVPVVAMDGENGEWIGHADLKIWIT